MCDMVGSPSSASAKGPRTRSLEAKLSGRDALHGWDGNKQRKLFVRQGPIVSDTQRRVLLRRSKTVAEIGCFAQLMQHQVRCLLSYFLC